MVFKMSAPGLDTLDTIVINEVSMPVVFETLVARNVVEYTFIKPGADGKPVLVVRNLDPNREGDAKSIINAFMAADEKYSPKGAIERALLHYQQDTVGIQPPFA